MSVRHRSWGPLCFGTSCTSGQRRSCIYKREKDYDTIPCALLQWDPSHRHTGDTATHTPVQVYDRLTVGLLRFDPYTYTESVFYRSVVRSVVRSVLVRIKPQQA